MLVSQLCAAASALILTQTAGEPELCESTAGHRGYTILLDSQGRFVHCRRGEPTETPPFDAERVVLQLPPVEPSRPYRFRLVDPNKPAPTPHRRLFEEQLALALRLDAALHELSASPDTTESPEEAPAEPPPPAPGKDTRKIADIVIPPAMGPAATASVHEAVLRREEYLTAATSVFTEAVGWLRQALPVSHGAATEVDAACGAKETLIPEGALKKAVSVECDPTGPGHRLTAALGPLEEKVDAFLRARRAARDALVLLSLKPTSAAEQDAAAKSASGKLQDATTAAQALLEEAPKALAEVERFLKALKFLRIALSIPASHVEGHRIVLGRFSSGGLFSAPVIYQLHVSREPSALFDLQMGAGEEAEATPAPAEPASSGEMIVDRFEPTERRYFSIELAAMYSGGLPDHPALVGRLGQQTLAPEVTQGFAGGVGISLEPLQFFRPEESWAQLLRFPTVIVPFTLDPLTNYFLGAGIGWNDIGSIDFGTHLALTSVPAAGTPYGTVFTTSPVELDHVTQTGHLAGGYFVSLSLDVLGIVHFFFARQHAVVNDVYSGASLSQK